MIDTIATRRTTLNGTSYAKGEKVPMPLQQFQDFEPTGLFERAPAEKKASAPAAKPVKDRAKPAPAASKPEPKSSNAAD